MSQAHRNPMLLFEFEAALFQFDEREPQFAPLFQLPPKIAALIPGRPLLFLPFDPHVQHPADLADQSLGEFELMMAHAALNVKKSHPEAKMRESRICRVKLADLIGFSGLKEQVRLPHQALQKQIAGHAMLSRHRLSNRVKIPNHTFEFLDNGHLVVACDLLIRLLGFVAHPERALSRP